MLYEDSFKLSPILPFRLDLTVWALRRRQKNHIDAWDGATYTRVFVINEKVIQSRVTQIHDVVEVKIESYNSFNDAKSIIASDLKKMLGLEINMEEFYYLSKNDINLQLLAESFIGVKPPRFPTIFEALLNSIACQQVTLDLGILLLNRLAENYGMKFECANGTQYAFPRPDDLAGVTEENIKKLGFSYQKARAIIGLSQALLEKKLSFSDIEELPNEEIVNRLIKIRGIGRWSAEYALLRGLGRIDTFPGDDVGAQKNLMQLMNLQKRPDYDQIKQLTSKWQPYAGLVYFHLLLEKLQGKGVI